MNITELGTIIRTRRHTLGLDQRGLAEIADLSVHSLSDIESGKGNPTFTVVNKLCAALGLDLRVTVRRPQDGTGAES